jgi:very-short-patch-repair endonuclease
MKQSNLKCMKNFRQLLRNKGTHAEAVLWKLLRNRQLAGRKFRRQHSIGNFILDFYCPQEKLCIELDGQPHFTQSGKFRDLEKTGYLENLGINVLRFENKLVFENLEIVLNTIQNNFIKTPTSPSCRERSERIGGAPNPAKRDE